MSFTITTSVRFAYKKKYESFDLNKEHQMEDIVAIHASRNWSHFNENLSEAINRKVDKHVYLLALDKIVKGYTVVYDLQRGADETFLCFLATHADSKGHDLGKRLMQKVFQKAKQYGIPTVFITCRDREKLVGYYNSVNCPKTISRTDQRFPIYGDPRGGTEAVKRLDFHIDQWDGSDL